MLHLVAGDDVATGTDSLKAGWWGTCFRAFLPLVLKGEGIGRGGGEAGVGVLCSLDCFLLSGGVNNFGDKRKLRCWPSSGRADCFTCCPGSARPFGVPGILVVLNKNPESDIRG